MLKRVAFIVGLVGVAGCSSSGSGSPAPSAATEMVEGVAKIALGETIEWYRDFLDARKFEGGLCCCRLHWKNSTLNAQRPTFNVQFRMPS